MLTAPNSSISPAETRTQDPLVDAACYRLVGTMMDNLLHDARNPLNALSINIEVLTERLRRESGGTLPPQHEKTLRTMREQVLRVDGIMKEFADFISPRPAQGETTDFSEAVLSALTVIGHEGRKRRVELHPLVESGVKVRAGGQSGLPFLAIAPIARAIGRSVSGGEVRILLRCEEGQAVFRIEDAAVASDEVSSEALHAMRSYCQKLRGDLAVEGGSLEIRLPLA